MLTRRTFLRAALSTFMAALWLYAFPAWSAPTPQTRRLRKWMCTNQDCDPYIYDPSMGDENVADPDHPIPPGTAFKDLPEGWLCPLCSDGKSAFVPLKEWVIVDAKP